MLKVDTPTEAVSLLYSVARSRFGLTSRWSVVWQASQGFAVTQRKWFGPHKGKYSLLAQMTPDKSEYVVSLFKGDERVLQYRYSFASGSVSNFP